MMNLHPSHELLAAFLDRTLDGEGKARIIAHLADCSACSAVVGAIRGSKAAPAPAASRRGRLRAGWVAAAALWVLAAGAGALVPLSRPEFVHIDFSDATGFILAEGSLQQVKIGGHLVSTAGAERIDDWWTISFKLPEPLTIDAGCTMKIDFSTNAGYCVASLHPVGKDAVFLKLEPGPAGNGWTTVTASTEPRLKKGDRVDWITISAPAGEAEPVQLLVRAVNLGTAN